MPPADPAFATIPLERGVTLHHRRSDRFKTELVRVFLRAPLDNRRTERHLFAALQSRGTRAWPSRRDLAARLQDLYGAGYGVTARRMCGRHVVAYRASTVAGRYLPGRPRNLRSMLDFLSDALNGLPCGSDGLPDEAAFEEERRELLRELHSRVDNKARYAALRLREEMYAGHPLAEPDEGREERVRTVDRAATLAAGEEVIARGEADVYLLAPCTAAQAERLVRRHLHLAPRPRERFRPPQLPAPRRRFRRVREAIEVEQGKLALGLRIADWRLGESQEDSILADGILGGGPASKLFRNVREARSLCYDVRSHLDRVAGTWFVTAGIRPDLYEPALAAIRRELRAMEAGRITDDEVAAARRQVLTGLDAAPDHPAGLVELFYRRRLLGRRDRSLEGIIRRIRRASGSGIPDLVARARLDTVFFLDRAGRDARAPA